MNEIEKHSDGNWYHIQKIIEQGKRRITRATGIRLVFQENGSPPMVSVVSRP